MRHMPVRLSDVLGIASGKGRQALAKLLLRCALVVAILLASSPSTTAGAVAGGPPKPLAGPRASALQAFAGGLGRGPAINVGQQPAAMASSRGFLVVADLPLRYPDSQRTILRKIDLATNYETVMGGAGGIAAADADGADVSQVRFQGITQMAADTSGTIYAYDSIARRIFKIDAGGAVTTLAGAGQLEGEGIQARDARISEVSGLLARRDGSVLISEKYDYRVRRIDQSGIISTFAGGGPCCDLDGGDGGPATSASLPAPRGLAEDITGQVFVAAGWESYSSSGHPRIRRIDTAGDITTVAGLASGDSGDGGPALLSGFTDLGALGMRSDGSLVIADVGARKIRQINPLGQISTAASIPGASYGGQLPESIATDISGSIFASDQYGARIYRIDSSDAVSQFAGTGNARFGGDGGPAIDAQFSTPGKLLDDGIGNLYISDGPRLRKIDAAGVVTTIAGNDEWSESGDGGPATSASLGGVHGLTKDSSGNIFVAAGSRVRRIAPNGEITTVAGGATWESGFADGAKATAVNISPVDVSFDDRTSSLWIAEAINYISCGYGSMMYSSLLRVDSGGQIWRVTDSIGHPELGGLSSIARDPSGGVVAASGLEIEGSCGNYTTHWPYYANLGQYILKPQSAGIVSTISGNGVPGFAGEDEPANLGQWSSPAQLTYDGVGNLFIADAGNARIRAIDSAGRVGTFAGNGTFGTPRTGDAPDQTPLCPAGVASRALSVLFASNGCDGTIVKIDRSPDPALRETYFAEGTVRTGFAEYLTIQNPEDISATTFIEFQGARETGEYVAIPPYSSVLAPHSRTTISVAQFMASLGIAGPLDVSTKITSNRLISAERPMYFDTDQRLGGHVTGGTTSAGIGGPATKFHFAEGTYRQGFVEYLTLQNPGDSDGVAIVTLGARRQYPFWRTVPTPTPPGRCRFVSEGYAEPRSATIALPRNSRTTLNLTAELKLCGVGQPLDFGLTVQSSAPIVAERPIYFLTDPGVGTKVNGATLTSGRTAYGNDFSFTEGTVRPGFVEYLVIDSADPAPHTATISYQVVDDAGRVWPVPDQDVLLTGRATVNVGAYLASRDVTIPVNVSARVVSEGPVIAERVMYFSSVWPSTGAVDGGGASVGSAGPANDFSLPEGTVRPGFQEYLTLRSANSWGSGVFIYFDVSDDEGNSIPVDFVFMNVGPNSRSTFDVSAYFAKKGIHVPVNVSVRISSYQVFVERPVYFNATTGNGVNCNGGTIVSAIPL